jgi:hypothetical protein
MRTTSPGWTASALAASALSRPCPGRADPPTIRIESSCWRYRSSKPKTRTAPAACFEPARSDPGARSTKESWSAVATPGTSASLRVSSASPAGPGALAWTGATTSRLEKVAPSASDVPGSTADPTAAV